MTGVMTGVVLEAYRYAKEAHKDQVRKYTGQPYFWHCHEVAVILMSYGITDPDTIAIAYLHDVIEDCGRTEDELTQRFNAKISSGVALLSDPAPVPGKNRATRKAETRARLSAAPADVQTVKCCDLISNGDSIVIYDKKFAVVYLAEAEALHDALLDADPQARRTLKFMIEQWKQQI